MSHIHASISIGHFQVHPSIHSQAFTCHPSINPSIHPAILLHSHTLQYGCWLACNHLFFHFWNDRSSLCSSFVKWTLQTLVGSSAFPITHLSSTLFLSSLSFMTLLCILDEMTELRVCSSICNPTIAHLITQSLSSRSFILLFFSRSLPKVRNYRPGCKTWGWDSICLSLITHSSHTHTHTFNSVCGGLTQRLRK